MRRTRHAVLSFALSCFTPCWICCCIVLTTQSAICTTCVAADELDDLFGEAAELPLSPEMKKRLESKQKSEEKDKEDKGKEGDAKDGKEAGKEDSGDAEAGKDKAIDKPKEKPKDEATRKLEAFYKEVEEMAAGRDKLTVAVGRLKEDLKREYQQNERVLAETDPGPLNESEIYLELVGRQRVIVLLAIELGTRLNQNSSQQYQLRQKISEQFREFRRKNPKLGSDPAFRQKEQALMNSVMQRAQRYGNNVVATMVQTRSELTGLDDKGQKEREGTRVHPGEIDGPMQNLREGIRGLVKLKWDGQNLVLDRSHWDTPFAGKKPADIRSQVDGMLESAGAPKSNDPNQHQQRAASRSSPTQSNVYRMFQELRGEQPRHVSLRSSGAELRLTLSLTDVSARMKVSENQFELTIEELDGPGRVFRLVEGPKGRLQMFLVGDMVHRFRQTKGEVSVVELVGDEMLTHKAESFAELYSKHPRFVDDRFLALLDHVGVRPPESRFDPVIVHRVVEFLRKDRAELRQEVNKLVADLDANRFTTREAAYNQLRGRIEEFYGLLHAKENGKDLSPEARARIRRLLKISEGQAESKLDGVISALQLLENVEYLKEVSDVSNEDVQKILEKHIGADSSK